MVHSEPTSPATAPSAVMIPLSVRRSHFVEQVRNFFRECPNSLVRVTSTNPGTGSSPRPTVSHGVPRTRCDESVMESRLNYPESSRSSGTRTPEKVKGPRRSGAPSLLLDPEGSLPAVHQVAVMSIVIGVPVLMIAEPLA